MDEQAALRALLSVRFRDDLTVGDNYCPDRHLASRHAFRSDGQSPGHELLVLHFGILHRR